MLEPTRMYSALTDFLPADSPKGPSQQVRVMSEAWAEKHIFCPACGSALHKFKNNKPVADFKCGQCAQEYELKSKGGNFGSKIVDGAYDTMMERLNEDNAPNLLLLSYHKQTFVPKGFFAIPSRFFRPISIEKRKPLSPKAKRANWVGCNILLSEIPEAGRIAYLHNQQPRAKKIILNEWQLATHITQVKPDAKGWLLDVMLCVDALKKAEFSLAEIYAFEDHLKARHPDNNFVRDKIRQQLQQLRDIGYLTFATRGHYRLTHPSH